MSYGHPIASGHGCRIPDYRWSPTVLPPSQRRARRGRNAYYYVSVPRFRFTTANHRTSTSRASRSFPPRALPKHDPSLGRLLGKGVVSLVGGVLKFLVDEAFAGRRPTKAFEQFLSFLIVLAAIASSAGGLLLGCLYFLIAYADDFAEAAAVASMEDYDEEKRRMCVTRTASVEAPPTPEELRRAWEAARGRGSLAAKLLAGTLLSNLEPVVDQSYLRLEDGTIVGRRPGLKGWLRGYCPELVPHYKALMSYKALADKLRIALGIEEPDTLYGVIDFGEVEQKSLKFRKRFRLQATNGKTVMEGIHALFAGQGSAVPESGTAIIGKTRGGRGDRTVRGKEGQIAKTSVFSSETDTTELRAEAAPVTEPGARNAAGSWKEPEPPMAALEDSGRMTMAALEEVVRERLGLCWMRRAGRRPKPA